ncbi:unnamed protein product, partial [marine sediment metagenome]
QEIIKQRFKDFALRMAKSCFYKRECKGKKELISEVEGYLNYLKNYQVLGWDAELIGVRDNGEKVKDAPLCNDFDDYFDSYRGHTGDFNLNKLGSNIACCIRAGIDVANPDNWGGGVIGFTVGDLRKMYPEGIPDWIKANYKNWKEDDLSDDESIWL